MSFSVKVKVIGRVDVNPNVRVTFFGGVDVSLNIWVKVIGC